MFKVFLQRETGSDWEPSQSSNNSHQKSSQEYLGISYVTEVDGMLTQLSPDEDESEVEGADLTGATLLAEWSSLLSLLTICRQEGCGAAVSPCNMKTSLRGMLSG